MIVQPGQARRFFGQAATDNHNSLSDREFPRSVFRKESLIWGIDPLFQDIWQSPLTAVRVSRQYEVEIPLLFHKLYLVGLSQLIEQLFQIGR